MNKKRFPTLEECEEYIKKHTVGDINEESIGTLWAYIESYLIKQKKNIQPVETDRRLLSELNIDVDCSFCLNSCPGACFQCGASQIFVNYKTISET